MISPTKMFSPHVFSAVSVLLQFRFMQRKAFTTLVKTCLGCSTQCTAVVPLVSAVLMRPESSAPNPKQQYCASPNPSNSNLFWTMVPHTCWRFAGVPFDSIMEQLGGPVNSSHVFKSESWYVNFLRAGVFCELNVKCVGLKFCCVL